MAFSPDGRMIASIGLDDDHSAALYEWKTSKLIGSNKGNKNKVLDITFHSNTGFVTW